MAPLQPLPNPPPHPPPPLSPPHSMLPTRPLQKLLLGLHVFIHSRPLLLLCQVHLGQDHLLLITQKEAQTIFCYQLCGQFICV